MFVKADGDTVVQNRGILSDFELRTIQRFIKKHYKEMYLRWEQDSDNGYYQG